MALNTIQPNRINLGGSFNFTGIVEKNGVSLATIADLATGASTISNKTIDNSNTINVLDTLFTLQDEGDPTRQVRFQLSGITAGQTRVLTVPDLSDTLVTLTALQNLTQKTLISPVINVGSDATGDMYYRTAGGLFQRLGVGTEGQSVTMQDTGLPGYSDGAPPLMFGLAGHNRANASGDVKAWDTWQALTDNDSRLVGRDNTTANTHNYRGVVGARGLINTFATVAGLAANTDLGCRIRVGGVDRIIYAANAAATLYIADPNGANIATVTFSGTAPTNIVRVGWDHVNNRVLIADGANKAATQIRQYTISGTTLTNINSDITLSVAPANAGPGTIFYGRNYILVCDTAGTATSTTIQRYNRVTGTKIDTITIVTLGSATINLGALVWSVKYNKLYMFRYYSTLATVNSGAFELLDID